MELVVGMHLKHHFLFESTMKREEASSLLKSCDGEAAESF
jgi:hypothetical protein